MQSENVYVRARRVVREVAPLLRVVRRQDRALADQLKRAARLKCLLLNDESHE